MCLTLFLVGCLSVLHLVSSPALHVWTWPSHRLLFLRDEMVQRSTALWYETSTTRALPEKVTSMLENDEDMAVISSWLKISFNFFITFLIFKVWDPWVACCSVHPESKFFGSLGARLFTVISFRERREISPIQYWMYKFMYVIMKT